MAEMMKAAVLYAPGKLVYEEVPIPEPGDRDVLLKVTACGITEPGQMMLIIGTRAFRLF